MHLQQEYGKEGMFIGDASHPDESTKKKKKERKKWKVFFDDIHLGGGKQRLSREWRMRGALLPRAVAAGAREGSHPASTGCPVWRGFCWLLL